jgi:hypothetical protein
MMLTNIGGNVKHLAEITAEFSKQAVGRPSWDRLSLDAQKAYLRDHPGSKRRLTAKPQQKTTDTPPFREKLINEPEIARAVWKITKTLEYWVINENLGRQGSTDPEADDEDRITHPPLTVEEVRAEVKSTFDAMLEHAVSIVAKKLDLKSETSKSPTSAPLQLS